MKKSVVIAMGTFDGVHLGHQYLIKKTVALAEKENVTSAVYTFSNIPGPVVSGNQGFQIMSPKDKVDYIKSMGVDLVLIKEFDEQIMTTTREDFLQSLCNEFDVRTIVVGSDYRFGKDGAGTSDWLREVSPLYGYKLSLVDFVSDSMGKISSTRIRKLLREGKVSKAAKLLGRHFSFKGVVKSGLLKDSVYDIEVSPSEELSLLKAGCYQSEIHNGNTAYRAVTKIVNNLNRVTTCLVRFSLDQVASFEEVRIKLLKKID